MICFILTGRGRKGRKKAMRSRKETDISLHSDMCDVLRGRSKERGKKQKAEPSLLFLHFVFSIFQSPCFSSHRRHQNWAGGHGHREIICLLFLPFFVLFFLAFFAALFLYQFYSNDPQSSPKMAALLWGSYVLYCQNPWPCYLKPSSYKSYRS